MIFYCKKFPCCWFHKVQTELLRSFIMGGVPTLWSKAQVSSWLYSFWADTVLKVEFHLPVTTYQLIEDFSLFIHVRTVFWFASAKVFATLPCWYTKLLILIPWPGCGRGCPIPSLSPIWDASSGVLFSLCKKHHHSEVSHCQFVQWVQEEIICHKTIQSEVSFKYVSHINYII